MKTYLIAFLIFFCAASSLTAQPTPVPFHLPTPNVTSIRSIIAQGGQLRMLLHVAEAGTYQIAIYSSNGQLVSQESLPGQAGEVVKDIAFTGNPHGIYVVNLVGANGQISREVMW